MAPVSRRRQQRHAKRRSKGGTKKRQYGTVGHDSDDDSDILNAPSVKGVTVKRAATTAQSTAQQAPLLTLASLPFQANPSALERIHAFVANENHDLFLEDVRGIDSYALVELRELRISETGNLSDVLRTISQIYGYNLQNGHGKYEEITHHEVTLDGHVTYIQFVQAYTDPLMRTAFYLAQDRTVSSNICQLIVRPDRKLDFSDARVKYVTDTFLPHFLQQPFMADYMLELASRNYRLLKSGTTDAGTLIYLSLASRLILLLYSKRLDRISEIVSFMYALKPLIGQL
jgi:hypothetical protein